MGNLAGFKAADYESEGYTPLPSGEYLMSIVSSEMKQNKAKTGEILKLKFEILEGDKKGRTLFENLNISHPNADAVRIGKETLAKICNAIGKEGVNDSSELHDIPMKVFVSLVKGNDGDMQNRLKKFINRSESSAPAASSGPSEGNRPF